MKAWRLQPCPRNDKGRKRKGANRRAKLADQSMALRNVLGVPPLLERMFSLGEVARTAGAHLAAMQAEKEARRGRAR